MGFFYYYYQWPGGESFFWGGMSSFLSQVGGGLGHCRACCYCPVVLLLLCHRGFFARPMTGDRRVDDPWSAEDRSLIYGVPETPGQKCGIKELSESDVTLCERSAMGISSNRVSSLEDSATFILKFILGTVVERFSKSELPKSVKSFI